MSITTRLKRLSRQDALEPDLRFILGAPDAIAANPEGWQAFEDAVRAALPAWTLHFHPVWDEDCIMHGPSESVETALQGILAQEPLLALKGLVAVLLESCPEDKPGG